MWEDKLKNAGVNIHVMATGGGARIQQMLWEIPGSSAYLSGASFPYDQEEQSELLGFMPDQFCSEEAAINLAAAAYMKAYKFGGKKPVGLGITASVASEREHRGDHRVFACVMTNDKVLTHSRILKKGVGKTARLNDGEAVDHLAFYLLIDALGCSSPEHVEIDYTDATDKARELFFKRPFFTANGKRLAKVPQGAEQSYAMMPGSFNPPHAGHLGLAETFRAEHGKSVLFEIGTNPPHKTPPTVQELLQRAKLLKGQDVLFSRNMPMYIEKAAMFHGMDFIVGADTMLRILDPKWGVDPVTVMNDIWGYGNEFYISGREIDGKFVTRDDVCEKMLADNYGKPSYEYMERFLEIMHHLEGRWDISSSEIRNKLK